MPTNDDIVEAYLVKKYKLRSSRIIRIGDTAVYIAPCFLAHTVSEIISMHPTDWKTHLPNLIDTFDRDPAHFFPWKATTESYLRPSKKNKPE